MFSQNSSAFSCKLAEFTMLQVLAMSLHVTLQCAAADCGEIALLTDVTRNMKIG